jgi:hypothetical protein
MMESVGLLAALATAAVILGRVLVLAIALRGTQPSERPAIIRALRDFVGTGRSPSRHPPPARRRR